MGLGSYILYLRALKGGITPRELAAELGMPEHYIHAIELEKHAGNIDSRSKLAAYFNIPIEDFNEYARSTHLRFMEILKKERRPQMGFLLMSGETLMGTVDGADTSIIKIVELNTGAKTILQRHAIKKWWPLKSRSERFEDSGSSEYRSGGGPGSLARRPSGPDGPGGGRPPRPSGPAGPPRPNRPSVFSDRDRPDIGNEREPTPRRTTPKE